MAGEATGHGLLGSSGGLALAPAVQEVGSVAELLALPDETSDPPPFVRLRGLAVRRRRRRAKDKLCFYLASDRASGSACDVELRVHAGSGPGEMAPDAAAAVIRTVAVGSVLRLVEGTLSSRWSDTRRTLSCSRVELQTAHPQSPTLLFDLNYWDAMGETERSAIRRQLRLSYAFNRRTAHAFRICLGGEGLLAPAASSALAASAEADGWARWEGVRLVDDAEPWRVCGGSDGESGGGGRLVYLCAASADELGAVEADCTYVVGALADHHARPGASLELAQSHGLETARLPLERFIKMHTRQAVSSSEGGGGGGGGGGFDVTTLAVVQMLVLQREYGDWGEAISRCAALQCAPMRKYVRWLPPYEHLNDAVRPADLVLGS